MQHNGLSEIKIKSTDILLDNCKEVYLEIDAKKMGSKNAHVSPPECRTGS
jgi:hypothetical protein